MYGGFVGMLPLDERAVDVQRQAFHLPCEPLCWGIHIVILLVIVYAVRGVPVPPQICTSECGSEGYTQVLSFKKRALECPFKLTYPTS